jgi:hypothetical protein
MSYLESYPHNTVRHDLHNAPPKPIDPEVMKCLLKNRTGSTQTLDSRPFG